MGCGKSKAVEAVDASQPAASNESVKGVFKEGISGGDPVQKPAAPQPKKHQLAPDEPLSAEIVDACNLELEPMSPPAKPKPAKLPPRAADSGLRGAAQAAPQAGPGALKPGKADDFTKISDDNIDPTSTHVLEVRAAALRRLPALRAPKEASVDELAEAERALVSVLSELQGMGEYLPLEGSQTYPLRPGGMTSAEAGVLRSQRLLFEADPQARGVFAAESGLFAAQVNDADHVRLLALERGPDLKAALLRLGQAESIMREALRQGGHELAPSDQASAVFEATVRVPLLKAGGSFEACCSRLQLTSEPLTSDTYRLVSAREQGSDVEQASAFVEAVRQLVAMETGLEVGAAPPPMDVVPPPKACTSPTEGEATGSTPAPSPAPASEAVAIRSKLVEQCRGIVAQACADGRLEESLRLAAPVEVTGQALPVVTARIAHWS